MKTQLIKNLSDELISRIMKKLDATELDQEFDELKAQ